MATGVDDGRIAKYRQTMRLAWGHDRGDTNQWPIKLNAAMHLFYTPFGAEFLDDLSWLEAQGHSLESIARDFYNPGRFFRVIDPIVYSMRRNRYPISRQREVITKLLDLTSILKHGSEFNEDGCNAIYDEALADEASQALQPTASLTESQLTHRFCAALWAYTEAICFGAHDLTKEFHGPYTCPRTGASVIVKEFLNLRPSLLWPDVPLLPCDRIIVSQRYSPAVRLAIDPHGHVSHSGDPLVPSLVGWAVAIDGVARGADVVSQYLPVIQEAIAAIGRYMRAADWNTKVLKYAEVYWFRKKPLADRRGRDWRLPQQVRDAIAAGHPDQRWAGPVSKETGARLAMVSI